MVACKYESTTYKQRYALYILVSRSYLRDTCPPLPRPPFHPHTPKVPEKSCGRDFESIQTPSRTINRLGLQSAHKVQRERERERRRIHLFVTKKIKAPSEKMTPLKPGKKRRESSKGNCCVISPKQGAKSICLQER